MKIKMKRSRLKGGSNQNQNGNASAQVTGPQDQNQESLTGEQTEEIATLNRLHEEIFGATRLTAEKAIDLGGRLEKLRQRLGHGKWLPFVKAHLSFSAKTAQRYMNVFHKREELEVEFDTVSNFTLSEAYRFLAGSKETVADKNEKPEEGESNAGAEKGAVITELSRSVCAGLEQLSDDLIRRFMGDLLAFKKDWIQQHLTEAKN